jgi:hypothetical protein
LTDEELEDEVVAAHDEVRSLTRAPVNGFAVTFGVRRHLTPSVVRAARRVDAEVVSDYGGRVGATTIHGEPELRRVAVWGNVGTLWHRLRFFA